MWKCTTCGEQIDDQFEECWKCADEVEDTKNFTQTAETQKQKADKYTAQYFNNDTDNEERTNGIQNQVVITDIQVPFLSLVVLLIKAAFAAIPATFVIVVTLHVFNQIIGYF